MKFLPILILIACTFHLGYSQIANCDDPEAEVTCPACSGGFVGAPQETAPFDTCIIENCSAMDETETAKCKTCKEGYTGASDGASLYTACNLTPIPNCADVEVAATCAACSEGFVGAPQEATPFDTCIIENCSAMDETETAKCKTCKEGFTGVSAEGESLFTACNEDSTPSGPENCKTPTTGDASTCDECNANWKGKEDAPPFSECVAAVENCKTYNSDPAKAQLCSECLTGFTAEGEPANEHTGCTCDADKIKKDGDNANICVSAAIEKCSAYEGIDTCKTCESGYSPADDKKTCSEATVDPPAASGSVISFSLVLTIVGLLIA